jgi:hypothetical protein
VGWKKHDLFFRVVELPFTLGVLCHACYIVFLMSDETRWTWYYTSWILLASLLLARVTSLVLRPVEGSPRSGLAVLLPWVCLLGLIAAWVKISFLHDYRHADNGESTLFEQVAEAKGIGTAFAFDKPGRIAYYSSIRVITLDNLMGNILFQRDLIAQGVNAYAAATGVDTFIGPPVPLNRSGYTNFCQTRYLDSVLFHCVQTGPDAWMPTSVEVYSRIPHADVGALQLDPNQLLWTEQGKVSFWRITPTVARAAE